MKRALFVAGDGRPGDAVLVNAIIGDKRLGDVSSHVPQSKRDHVTLRVEVAEVPRDSPESPRPQKPVGVYPAQQH